MCDSTSNSTTTDVVARACPDSLFSTGLTAAGTTAIVASVNTGFIFMTPVLKAYGKKMSDIKKNRKFESYLQALTEARANDGLTAPSYMSLDGPNDTRGEFVCRELAVFILGNLDAKLSVRMTQMITSRCPSTAATKVQEQNVRELKKSLEAGREAMKTAKELQKQLEEKQKELEEKQAELDAKQEELLETQQAHEEAEHRATAAEVDAESVQELQSLYDESQTELTTLRAQNAEWERVLEKASEEVKKTNLINAELFKSRQELLEEKEKERQHSTGSDTILSKWKLVKNDEEVVSAPPEIKKRLVSALYERLLLDIEEDTKRRRTSGTAAAAAVTPVPSGSDLPE